jgi:hypothetical protein
VLAPKPVPGLAGITFTEVRVGRDHSMAFGGGKFFTWGRNDGGQLGVPPADTPDTQRATPARVTALASARDAGGGQGPHGRRVGLTPAAGERCVRLAGDPVVAAARAH